MVTLQPIRFAPAVRLVTARYAFRPPLWSILPLVLMMALLVWLGTWQLGRAHEKQALQAAFETAGERPAIRLETATPAADMLAAQRGQADGSYDPHRQLLLDNQGRERVPGYHVWTPLRLADGGWLVVDRGWVAADPDRRRLPQIDVSDAPRHVGGYWRPLPEPGLRLAADPCSDKGFPRVLSYPTREQLACVLDGPVADGLLLLDPDLPDGYVREWTLPNPVPPARHYAYAAQWFAFAATLLFLFIKYSLRRLT